MCFVLQLRWVTQMPTNLTLMVAQVLDAYHITDCMRDPRGVYVLESLGGKCWLQCAWWQWLADGLLLRIGWWQWLADGLLLRIGWV